MKYDFRELLPYLVINENIDNLKTTLISLDFGKQWLIETIGNKSNSSKPALSCQKSNYQFFPENVIYFSYISGIPLVSETEIYSRYQQFTRWCDKLKGSLILKLYLNSTDILIHFKFYFVPLGMPNYRTRITLWLCRFSRLR